MGDIANKDESQKCLAIARQALGQGDVGKAEKFALKAQRLYSTPEIERLLGQIEHIKRGDSEGDTSGRSEQQQPQAGASGDHARGNHAHGGANHARNHAAHNGSAAEAGQGAAHKKSGEHATTSGREGARHRPGARSEQTAAEDQSTPEQRALVAQILKAKDLYEILGVARNASDDDIKKAYRKLALKLHPDKNSAHKADEAFKAVGKAFACLSDPDKREYYNRTGYESSAAAASAQSQAASATPGGRRYTRGPGGMYYGDDFDPEEIFNMFFGGLNPNARVFRQHFGGPPQRRQHQTPQGGQGGGDDMSRVFLNLAQFLPILLILFFSWFATSGRPAYSLVLDRNHYTDQVSTSRLNINFYVRSKPEFDRSHPQGSASRYRLERQVESEYYEHLSNRCQQEKLAKHRLWSWGNKDEARKMPMPSCDEVEEMNRKLGAQRQSSHYYF